jgi:prophage tail gpP-like protein
MSDPHGAPPRSSPITTSDVLTLQVGNQQLSGWQRVQVIRSMDSIPASFAIGVTEKYPNTPDIDLQAGQECTVSIGGDLVLTGYVDQYTSNISAGSHNVQIAGRSKAEDLQDCSAFIGPRDNPSFQVRAGNALSIAQAIAKTYGVTVQSMAGPGADVQQFNINLGETCWEIIDRLARVSGFVAYDMPDGSLMLARAGTEKMASGFALGVNIEQATITYRMDNRFSDYEAHFIAVVTYGVGGQLTDTSAGPIVHDEGVPRFRKRFVISEQMSDGQSLAQQRAMWERNRNWGRAQQFNVTCDSWRDAAGKLWAPNCLAPISAAAMKVVDKTWVIGGVTYRRDEGGQHADLVLMPKEAFSVEPAVLNPLPPSVEQMERNNATKPQGTDLKLPQGNTSDLNTRGQGSGNTLA